jgi:hypothetical protein
MHDLDSQAGDGTGAPEGSVESWRVCPFECCTYQEWAMGVDIDVHESVVSNPGCYTVCVLANVSAR